MTPEEFIVGQALDDFVPGLRLTFEGEWIEPDPKLPDGLRKIARPFWAPVRPSELGLVLTTIDEIYLASIRSDLPPRDFETRPDWAIDENPRSLTMRATGVEMGSPLNVLLELPATLYIPTFAAFAYGISHVFGIPYRAATIFEKAREGYFDQRHATAEAKDAWLDYKAKRVQSGTSFRLRKVERLLDPSSKSADTPTPEKPDSPS